MILMANIKPNQVRQIHLKTEYCRTNNVSGRSYNDRKLILTVTTVDNEIITIILDPQETVDGVPKGSVLYVKRNNVERRYTLATHGTWDWQPDTSYRGSMIAERKSPPKGPT